MGRPGKATLVGASDAEAVLDAFDDSALADGVGLTPDGALVLPADGELKRCFKKESWDEAALWALRRTGRLDDVTRLTLAGSRSLTSLAALRGLSQLERLDVSQCGRLDGRTGNGWFTDIEALRSLSGLTYLNLSAASGFTSLEALDRHPALRTLNVSTCITPWNRLQSMGGIRLPALQRLDLSHSYALRSLESLHRLDGVEAVSLHRCVELPSTAGIDALVNLRRLDLTACDRLARLDDLGRLERLEELSLHFCFKLEGFDALGSLKSLQALDLCGCGTAMQRWLDEVGDQDAGNFAHLETVRTTCLAVAWSPYDGGTSPFC
jgi:Leucine-rich repeat (LRR) protein